MLGRLVFKDLLGRIYAPTFHSMSWTDVQNLGNTLAAYSAVRLVSMRGTYATNPTPYAMPSNGIGTIADIAVLYYARNNIPGYVQLIVPNPREDIFLPDGETVDPSAITGLTTAVCEWAITPGGDPPDTFVRGLRRYVNHFNGI